jgi:DNA-binding NtrC family response regulator
VILVVDDESAVRNLVCAILERGGYEVVAAADAREALEVLRQRTPEVLLTDIVMPGANGLALAAEAHRLRPGLRVLFMSGFASRYEDELSGSVCLRKPFTASQLLLAIEDLTGMERTAREILQPASLKPPPL